MIIKGLTFIKTCTCCPEQYNIKDNKGNQIGYIRLRWGELTCKYPDVGGEIIYCDNVDNAFGCFEYEEQRKEYLNIIADRILERINR